MSLNLFRAVQGILPLACLQWGLMATSAIAARQLFLSVGPAEFALDIQDLHTFSQTGDAPPLLKALIDGMEAEQQQQIRKLFSAVVEVDPILLSQFMYTPQGEVILQELGQVLQSESSLSGFYGLRAAIFQAAQANGRLTLASILEQFPGDRIRINPARLFELAHAWEALNQANSTAMKDIAHYQVPDPANIAAADRQGLQQPGPFQSVRVQTLETSAGDRADLYLPESFPPDASETPGKSATAPGAHSLSNPPDGYPLIVISHGLGGDRHSFRYLAQHYASHGFAVLAPEHPLSRMSMRRTPTSADEEQTSSNQNEPLQPPIIQANSILEHEWAQEVTPRDFAQRPQAISRLLNELERQTRTDSQLQQQVNTQAVGIVGQSFGAYTALALSGATINLQHLEQQCPADAMALNPSLLLQCQAIGLSQSQTQYRDPRIQAVAVLNPLGSALFGPEGMADMQLPILVLSADQDRVTPTLAEQIRPFSWLKTPHRYFMMLEGSTHFSLIGTADTTIDATPLELSPSGSHTDGIATKQPQTATPQHDPSPSMIWGKDPNQAKRQTQTTSLAFFRTHLLEQQEYRKFLTPTPSDR